MRIRNLLPVLLLAAVTQMSCEKRGVPEHTTRAPEPAAHTAPTATAGPIYTFNERELDAYLRQVHVSVPDFHQRIVAIARNNLNQPYEIYLLGEAPFETIDAQPVYCIGKSDCVVFAEHTVAMAMSDSFPQFLAVLQRIRYNDGQIGVVTRNHYTEADWNRNNGRWLVRDITDEIGGSSVQRFTQKVDRAKFFRDRYKLDTSIPIETISESFIPYGRIDSNVRSRLRDGDIVNFVSGRGDGFWVGHVGLVAIAPEGGVNLIHSASPQVREESIDAYISRATERSSTQPTTKASFRGFKFLRVSDDPWAAMRAIDGANAPRVTVPQGSPVTWPQFVESLKSGG
jgi:hypothetical protein